MSYFPWIIPSSVASIICVILAILIWKRRKSPAAKALYWILASVFIWAFCQTIILLLASHEWDIVLSKIQYIGIVFTPVAWFLFSTLLLNKPKLINSRRLVYLCIVPVITLLLVWTNEYHGLIWKETIISAGNRVTTSFVYGNWFKLHTLYSYGLIASAAFMAIYFYFKGSCSRIKVWFIILSPLLVVVSNLVYLNAWFDFGGVDLTPMGFSFALLMFSWILLKENLMQLAPIARSILFQKIEDAIVVLGPDLRVVDINISATKLFQLEASEVIGTYFVDSMVDENLIEPIIQENCSEVKIKGQHYQALRTIINIDKSGTLGYLIVFRNISELKQTQKHLLETRLELERANKSLKKLADTDPLTQLPNRRRFFENLATELERANRHDFDFCLVIMDLDHFKKINDNYGHPAGDEVLVRVANKIKSNTREVDHCGRIGGEEFAMILYASDQKNAIGFVERIRSVIETSHTGKELPITISIGLTQRKTQDSLETLYDRADRALYQSKETGRNKYTLL